MRGCRLPLLGNWFVSYADRQVANMMSDVRHLGDDLGELAGPKVFQWIKFIEVVMEDNVGVNVAFGKSREGRVALSTRFEGNTV